MTSDKRTWRTVDGVRIEGTRRPVFVDNGGAHLLTDLTIYADGVIDCQSAHLDLDGLAAALESGRVAIAPPPGSTVSIHHLATWTCGETRAVVTPATLLAEIADEIDRLNGRPGSRERCEAAAHAWAADPGEAERLALREAFLAVPEHRRRYFGARLWHYLSAITPVGEEAECDGTRSLITGERRDKARKSFAEQAAGHRASQRDTPADGPREPASAPIGTGEAATWALQIDHPAPIHYRGRDYRSVAHAYWALSTPDPAAHDRIAAAEKGYDAHRLAKHAPLRPGWPEARLAVMAELLRAKFNTHPALAEILRATGDARIVHHGLEGAHWTSEGTNWIGRLHELLRAELRLREGLR
ncbi:NADAR family protein [Phytomonospora endophytica]|uniref:Putative NAD-dependent protein-ADP-ribosyltransferase YbiA (DUF1768 family) n=1 Tax=Phytomonospora endophytica TaxID=714109 RepID=A0A841FPS9_9ACTN|nr:NADAR family protein [Phytomonospora endophytica]MBB6034569.1 putative NAD-dependent protein-ADP-ribosyltransferase YbiA (DUF1768 family) [Phytomonospora endophytica]GIG71371.1 hypothetical protein Pen01_76660 [Phytomonospora endophytica]